ncbi:MAG: sodium:alanine symporter family protein [gamma proteobacterium symbiont of Ctena orbiculata]|nr:MAG: sodium:alanine symporter family protein [gamma proteobacterium symbiont of Ctena orbiculata]PVV26226.1 MAG: sodium:alanine symporter family protein [gamma proteobacterium symbiont of Ctena orbiculata]
MENLTKLIDWVNGIVWGPLMLVLILGTGLFLMIGLKLMPLARLNYGFRMLWRGREGQGEGEISPFNALMTSLSATIGTGNIAGVATAIAIGGPGAIFWMWCTALVGMATKYAEAVLAVRYREVDENGNHVGGPMYYIKNGLDAKWAWLGTLFAIFGALAGFGIGNTVQANSVANALSTNEGLQIAPWVTGLVMAVLAALVLIGGIRRIAEVAGKLVPFMALAYLLSGFVVLVLYAGDIPNALVLIVSEAFTPTAATGGFAGAAVWLTIQFGVARGIFSNEAGLGSAPIAHAAAATDNPVRQGTVAMLGTFIDTLIVCSITGLAIVVTGAWTSGETSSALSSLAFETALPGIGSYVVSLGLAVFAFTTILGWSVYGERCVEYLFGVRSITPFRVAWIVMIPLGAVAQEFLSFVWLVADTLNALMAIPNLIALLLLSPVVFKLTRDYFASSAT